ncbi:hypothetical protein F5887DRAFT_933369 [Amanita rubescens]|nr:hypothetical protein F5887DRAFT_933369 [Amanita rubescens]
MESPRPPSLSLQARRLRTIIWTLPIIVGTTVVLYRRVVLEEPQRKLPDFSGTTENGSR